MGWRWIFWIAIPFGLAATAIGWLALPRTTGLAEDKVFDWWGALFLTPALVFLVLVLNQLSVWGPTSTKVIVCVGATAVLMALFIRRERRFAFPLVDLRLFRQPAFSCGAAAVMLSSPCCTACSS